MVGGLGRETGEWQVVENALVLISRHDPARYKRILQDIERVWVGILAGAVGEYKRSLNACVLDRKYVVAWAARPELIASAIVHEATHARLMHCGIGYEETIRARVEAVCFKREIAFAAKLPNGEEVRDLAERRLAYYGSEYWTNSAHAARFETDVVEAFRHTGPPEWLIRALARGFAVVRKLVRLFRRDRGDN
jgi:hypothetical protein